MSYPSDPKSWLAKLVSYDTTCTKSNLEIIYYIRDYLLSVGLKPQVVYSPDKVKAHLYCVLPGANGRVDGGIILSGHTDVVSVVGQKWDSDPWTLTEKDGKLYGRGASDMKGFLAVTLSLVPTFLSMKRAKPIHICFSYDEELGCVGIPTLIDYLKKNNVKADVCLVGDGHFQLCTGNKGHRLWRCKVIGKAIHSSMALMGTSCNAIEYAAMIITKVREIAQDIKLNDVHDKNYSCSYSPMSTNLIQGGNAVNTVPAECVFEFSIRLADTKVGKSVDARIRKYINEVVLPEMRKEHAEAAVELDAYNVCPPFNARESDAWTKLGRRLMKTNKVVKVGGTSESGFFQEDLNVPTLLIGSGAARDHEADEYTTVENLMNSHRVTLQLVRYSTETDKPLESHL